MLSAFRPMLLRGISAVSSALTTIWPPRSPCRSRLHDELVHSAQKIGGRVCVLQILLCQGQHRTMQQAHARVKGNTAQFSRESGAAPHNSASAFGERFFVETRFGKCRRTLCTRKGHAASVRRQSRQRLRNTSNFSNRWIGEEYPPKAEDAIAWCCLNIISQKEADANINLDAASAIFPAFPHCRRAARERHSLRESPNQSSAAEPRSFCRLIQRFPYLPREAKRISSVATSARVAVPCGSRRPLPIPRSRPTATAQRTAASA